MNQLIILQTLESLPLSYFKELSWTRFEEISKSRIVQKSLAKRSPIAIHSDEEIEAQKRLVNALTEEVFYAVVGCIANKLMEEL